MRKIFTVPIVLYAILGKVNTFIPRKFAVLIEDR